jgi:hypothetical protein
VERKPLGTVVMHYLSTTSQHITKGSFLLPLSLNRENMESASSKSNASTTASDSSKSTASMMASPSARFMVSASSKSNALMIAST